MTRQVSGIHHVTAIAGDPQRNLDFYAGVLGLRLVKFTVNYDDPGTYHFYFGDARGCPGTLLTFFPWPGAMAGRHGAGQLTATAFSVPSGSLGYWAERLGRQNVTVDETGTRFGKEVIAFDDPEGLRIELAGCDEKREGWTRGPVPAEHAIRGLFGVTLSEPGIDITERVLVETLGFRPHGQEGNRLRYLIGEGPAGSVVDVVLDRTAVGRLGAGTVHHVAWRARDGEEQLRFREAVVEAALNVTPVIDRKYFHSIYFREPGGVLFEVATEGPGFAIDEPADQLGTHLALPNWLEPRRAALERRLPSVRLPEIASAA